MDTNDAKIMAARKLTEGASVDELREVARDLRALSPDSALADLVEAEIERIRAVTRKQDGSARPAYGGRVGSSSAPQKACR